MELLIYLVLGAAAGVISGLFGLGGGVIIVPILILAFGMQGVSADVATHLALGTSLATIAVTSIPSIYTHAQRGTVRWDLVRWISPGIILGAILGGIRRYLVKRNMAPVVAGAVLCRGSDPAIIIFTSTGQSS